MTNKNNCIRCSGDVESSRRGSLDFYDFCFKCYKSFVRRAHGYSLRARRLGTPSSLSPTELIRIMRLNNFCCSHCKKTYPMLGVLGEGNYLSFDHVYPLNRGGMNHISNISILCRLCHDKKDNIKLKKLSPLMRKRHTSKHMKRKSKNISDKKIWKKFFSIGGKIDDNFKLEALNACLGHNKHSDQGRLFGIEMVKIARRFIAKEKSISFMLK